MTLGEFRKQTAHLSGNVDIMINQTNDETYYSTVENVAMKSIRLQAEDVPKKEWPIVECLVLTDQI